MRSILSNFPTEKITLIKKTGETIKDIEANVQTKKIFSEDASIIIEEGDVFERILPNGAIEQYLVIDRGFYKGMRGMPDHYQTSVEKVTDRKEKQNNIVYNINSESGKINVNSIDNSTTITLTENDEKTFETLLSIAKSMDNSEEIAENILAMKSQIGKPEFGKKYNDFIQSVANHMTIFAPFIPAITKFITG
jgi:hypothetical protein